MSTTGLIHYGNLIRPDTPGLGRYDRKTAIILIAQLIIVFVAWAASSSLTVGLTGIAFIGGFVALTYVRDPNGLTTWDRGTETVLHAWRKATKRNVYVSELLANDTTNLPGLLSGTRITEHHGPTGRFALVHHATGQVALVMICEPTGGDLHDQEAVNLMVGRWGAFGAQFAQAPGVDQYTVTIETGPNHGASALAAVQSGMDPDAPALARQINLDTTRMGSESRTTSTAYVTITFHPIPRGKGTTQDQYDDQTGAHIARRIKAISANLEESGGGRVMPATSQDLGQSTRIAYDPKAAAVVEQIRADGQNPVIDWDTVGPTHAEAHLKSYVHDDHASVTFKMTNAVRGSYHHHILSALLDAHPDIERKRVTLVKHPIPAGQAIGQVEMEYQDAKLKARDPRRRGDAEIGEQVAARIREAVNLGAAMEKFTLFVTVTVSDPDRLEDAVLAVEQQLAPSARMDTRIVRGRQDSAFAAALPLGLDLAAYARPSRLAAIRRYFS